MVYKIKVYTSPSHIHAGFFSAKAENMTYASLGVLTMDDAEWDELYETLRMMPNMIIAPPGTSKEIRQGYKIIPEPFSDEFKVLKFYEGVVTMDELEKSLDEEYGPGSNRDRRG